MSPRSTEQTGSRRRSSKAWPNPISSCQSCRQATSSDRGARKKSSVSPADERKNRTIDDRIVPVYKLPLEKHLIPELLSGRRGYHFYEQDPVSKKLVEYFRLGRVRERRRFCRTPRSDRRPYLPQLARSRSPRRGPEPRRRSRRGHRVRRQGRRRHVPGLRQGRHRAEDPGHAGGDRPRAGPAQRARGG